MKKPETTAQKAAVMCLGAAIILGAGYLGRGVKFEEQWPLYEALRTTAAIVFAVVGAWIAIIFPERFQASYRKEKPLSNENQQGLGRFLTPVAHSTAILGSVLLIGIIAPLIKQWPWLMGHVEWARGASYSMLTALTLWQLVTVVLTLDPADDIKQEADRTEQLDRRDRNRDVLTTSATNNDPLP